MKIFKILRENEWQEFESDQSFTGSQVDIDDGFIHFSTDRQLRGTLEKHFSNEDSLVLVAIESEKLIHDLKWEPSRGGDLFPHYYGVLSLNQVEDAIILNRDSTGQWMVDPAMNVEGE